MKVFDRNSNPNASPRLPRVLVVAPSAEARGGIASVVRMHRSTAVWKDFSCQLLGTYRGTSSPAKLFTALWAYLRAPFALSRADLVHFHLAAGMSVLRKSPLIWAASVLGKKIVLHFHCAGTESLFEATPSPLVSFLRSRADLVVVLSPWWKREFERLWPGVRITVVPNPAQPVCSGPRSPSGSGAELLFVGTLSKRKGYELLLAALADVIKECPVTLLMAGDGEVQNAKAIASRLGIDDAVRFPGWVSGDELERLYNQAQVFCLPSYAEGVPLSVLDAMGNGLAVITTPVGGIPDLIVDGVNGLLVPVGNSVALSTAILRLLQHPEERVRLGQEARQSIRDSHSTAHISGLLAQLYLSLRKCTGPAMAPGIHRRDTATARGDQ